MAKQAKVPLNQLLQELAGQGAASVVQRGPLSSAPATGPRIGAQPRAAEFGDGMTQRVYELGYKGVSLGVSVGDIAQAPTQSIMCPTTHLLQLGEGAVEWAIATANGQRDLEDKAFHALNGDKSVAYGEARGIKASGELERRGIKHIVLSNVLPQGGAAMSAADMASFTFNACVAAHRAGVTSLTIPAVGTGVAASFGFGMSYEDSAAGVAEGFKRFIEQVGGADQTPLRHVDFNLFSKAAPGQSTIDGAVGIVDRAKVADRLRA
jgi:O-acetyl-ADP-ribose deacetylase (regulator of RNase III)